MFAKVRSRLTYANVVASLALFFALGTGSALAVDTIFSEDIVNGEVKKVDIGGNAVDGSKVENLSLSAIDLQAETLSSGRVDGLDGTDIDDDGLTGADILESSLDTVPRATDATNATNAATATNATQLDGISRLGFMRAPTKWKSIATIGQRLPVEINNPACSGNRDCTASLRCDAGDVLLSGGYESVDNGTRVFAAFPFNANGNDQKYVMHWNNNSTADTISLRILCADQ